MCGKPEPKTYLFKYLRTKVASRPKRLNLASSKPSNRSMGLPDLSSHLDLSLGLNCRFKELGAFFLKLQPWAIAAACCRTRALAAGRMHSLGNQCGRITARSRLQDGVHPPSLKKKSSGGEECHHPRTDSALVKTRLEKTKKCSWSEIALYPSPLA